MGSLNGLEHREAIYEPGTGGNFGSFWPIELSVSLPGSSLCVMANPDPGLPSRHPLLDATRDINPL